jgi:tRNA (cytidine/uridine-2'-O-)-methyltransferase
MSNIDNTIRIPMKDGLRSLNLSNSVAIVAYEICRHYGFESLIGESEYFD